MAKLKWIGIFLVNLLLALIIVATIIATWMPAIYTSKWFKVNFPHL